MRYRAFGTTGMQVSVLGLGAGQLGDASLTEAEAARLLHSAIDHGITLIDTARGYGSSEARIGRHLGSRRGEVLLCTKVGYGIPGIPDWTGPCITAGIDAALTELRTPWLDVALLHSCPAETLHRGEVTAALERARQAGKVRAIGYSGEGHALDVAIASRRFQVLETSVNLCDQRGISSALARAWEQGVGAVAKRPMANAFWRHSARPTGQYCEPYWDRWQAMGAFEPGMPWPELALRFVLSTGVAHTAIVGTTSLASLAANVVAAEKGPLPDDLYAALRARFRTADAGWEGQV